MQDRSSHRPLYVGDEAKSARPAHFADVGDLTTGLGVEGRSIHQHAAFFPGNEPVDGLSIADQHHDARLVDLGAHIREELRRLTGDGQPAHQIAHWLIIGTLPGRARARARCASSAVANPSSSMLSPSAVANSRVSSMGRPNVS